MLQLVISCPGSYSVPTPRAYRQHLKHKYYFCLVEKRVDSVFTISRLNLSPFMWQCYSNNKNRLRIFYGVCLVEYLSSSLRAEPSQKYIFLWGPLKGHFLIHLFWIHFCAAGLVKLEPVCSIIILYSRIIISGGRSTTVIN